ncbi:YeeE/YedE family protein [Rivibacter subsaxonicus]|uniref:Uncharacterized protein n=1 Tax=Rivibacter subsaxonicus TaxID=457575 RepID=A0A4Q7VN23_9BURK|nr:YeeE/YedE family protein [Rivibacter subsaxonicus]RZT97689.1 hypothetical protein EV670_2082 [Rivibacter subsaxonicus]
MEPDLATLTRSVLAGGLLIGLLFGALAQRSRFCTMGALADLVTFGDATRLRMWALAALVALLGTQALILAGAVDLRSTVQNGHRLFWASNLVGGTLFGFGMVLASGCASRNLVRLGSGSLKALVVLGVTGLAALMTLRGVLAPLRIEWLDAFALSLAGPQDLPAWLARSGLAAEALLRPLLTLVLGALLGFWILRDRRFRGDRPALLGGAGIGALVVGAWFLTGHLGFVAEHPATLEPAWLATSSRRPEGLSFVAPLAYSIDLLTLWTDRNTTLAFGIATAIGIPLGSAAAALAAREFQWESFAEAGDLAHHLVGALLMGAGGVTALGCTLGQGVSGLSLLAVGAFIACAGFGLGAWLALRYQSWRIEREHISS